jgi:mannitol-1-/sugar-/sorbitol-6-/2-deoxyglucose-6-phosphatase
VINKFSKEFGNLPRLMNVCSMQYKAIIFDMDGLLIDSEPLWKEAGKETLLQYGKELSDEQYHSSTGLRTEEWIEHWFHHFSIDMKHAPAAIDTIITKTIDKIDQQGQPFPGIDAIIEFCKQKNFLLGLATSSPMSLVNVVLQKLQLKTVFDSIASAEGLPYGKPHPQVYINCADQLRCAPLHCIAFEDSFNGMIAAKAAKMKCVVIPAPSDYDHPKWNAADLKLKGLSGFNEVTLGFI